MIPLIILLLFIVAFYKYATRNHDYWTKRNVKHDPPLPLFGNHLRNQLLIKSVAEIATEFYNKYPNENVVGYYKGTQPVLYIRDLDLVKQVITTDFAAFYPRGLGRSEKLEPIFANLFHAEGDLWRLLRQRLTGAFTTAKLKAMFPLVVRCAERLQDLLGEGGDFDARDVMARFTTEFIGACGFGIEMNTINNERSQFRELGKRIFTRSIKTLILLPIVEIFPELRDKFRLDDTTLESNITEIVEGIRKQRNYKPIGRNDFIDLLLELEAKGKIQTESIEKKNPDGTPVMVEMEMDLPCMVAQVFVFFAAGFETSSSATSFTLHQLAYNPDVQRRVQQNIDEVMGKHNNKLSYAAISEMILLDMAFKEGMRMFPSLATLHRICMRKYTLPGTDITIDPGVNIIVPVQGIHMDEKYYDNPQEFRPERFTPEEVQKRHHYAYLPFGEGPRMCIGE